MKFELRYADGSKVLVDLPDPELQGILDNRAKRDALKATETIEGKRGAPVAVTLKP